MMHMLSDKQELRGFEYIINMGTAGRRLRLAVHQVPSLHTEAEHNQVARR